MHIKTRNRLIYWLFSLICFALGLTIILFNLSDNIAFFVTPTELLNKQIHNEVRLGGYAKRGSINKISVDQVEFIVTDRVNEIPVYFKGMIPIIFREDQGIVVTGSFDKDGKFIAKELLAKHDEKYMPKKVKEILD